VGYNVQVAVDTEHHLIVTHEVTNVGSDLSQLSHVAKEAKATLQTDILEAVADRGYFSGLEILACENSGITVTLPKPIRSGLNVKGRFGKQDFVYLPQQEFIAVRPVRGSAITIRLKKTECASATTGSMPVKAAFSNTVAPLVKSDGSTGGSMSMFSKRCRRGWTNIRKGCARDVRPSSTPSARSRHGWARHTS